MNTNIEESRSLNLDFGKLKKAGGIETDVLPVVVQDFVSKEVLVLGYMNELAFEKSFQTGKVVFWSTSRNELWEKGKSSGNELFILDVFVNCEQNSLLIMVNLKGVGACHTKATSDGSKSTKYRKSCYYRRVDTNGTMSFV
ncbi:phosphoribosyl-AMP cyclohydrolase [bacterium]|jgi:phosphoribosyl-AMP cyclohydrolase|nr:phosphoribosyl-AMP cyclohydrolase [bacterium]